MAAESSFDVVSEFDRQELVNVVDQTLRDVRTRYDLKDSNSTLELSETELLINTESEMHLTAIRDILQTKALRRNLSLKIFDFGTPEQAGATRVRQLVQLRKGIDETTARKLQKLIRDSFPKVQARIQSDTLRVASKSKDELQSVIRLLRERQEEFPVALQFTNFR